MPGQTPSQTVGPFFSHAMTPDHPSFRRVAANRLAAPTAPGLPIRIEGRVTDGAGDPVPDAMLEVWQAGPAGAYPDGSRPFRGFGRASTDKAGRYWFETVKPGSTAPGAAPHISLVVFARGMLNHTFTRLYFPDEVAANEGDELLASIGEDRRGTLIAALLAGGRKCTYQFDIRLRGEGETVFLDA